MNGANLRAITNHYQDVRLLSLREWAHAVIAEPHDNGGPYMVAQEGYDPQDANTSYEEFVLCKSGSWVTVGLFLKLPRETRRQEFVFGTAAEVIELLENLVGEVRIVRTGDNEAVPGEVGQPDDLTAAFKEACQKQNVDGESGIQAAQAAMEPEL